MSRGYRIWTKEKVIQKAQEFNHFTHWMKAYPGAVRAAVRKGWTDEATAHMFRKISKWTDDAIIIESHKYKSIAEWKEASINSYHASIRKGKAFHTRATSRMSRGKKIWTKKELIEDAKKYNTKKDWNTNNHNAYKAAYKFGWAFLEKATAHMAKLGNSHKRLVYKISVADTPIIYIGLTSSIERRFKDHLKSKRFTEISNTYGIEAIHVEAITKYIEAQEAAKLEEKLIEEYRKKGFTILNKVKGGNLGGFDELPEHLKKWSKSKLLDVAKQYETASAWSISCPNSYSASLKLGSSFHGKATAHMKKLHKSWSDQEIRAEAKKFKSIAQWRKTCPNSYNTSKRKGKLFHSISTAHMKKLLKHWSDEEILATAKHYPTIRQWCKKCPSSYGASIKKGKEFHAIATLHMKKLHNNWTEEAVFNEAMKHNSKSGWKKTCPNSYATSIRLGIHAKSTAHMKKPMTNSELLADAIKYTTKLDWRTKSKSAYSISYKKGPEFFSKATRHMVPTSRIRRWTKEACIKEAQKYKTKTQWFELSGSSYNAAKRNGWFDECIALYEH